MLASGLAKLEEDARQLLGSWLDALPTRVRGQDHGADFIAELDRGRLVVQCRTTSETARIRPTIAETKAAAARLSKNAVPVIAVPFMGDAGKKLCEEAGVSWFDVSGNAHIIAPGLRILIEGKPNKFLRRGRPSSAFAPKSARIARHMLIEPTRAFRQQELARETGLDDGFTSRIVHRLESVNLLRRAADGSLTVKDPDLLLDAWTEVYRFDRRELLRGHVSARSSAELVDRVAGVLRRRKVRYAATGLTGAWALTQHAEFRLATFFVAEQPGAAALKEMGFREESKGANLWLVMPDDEGVFDGAAAVGPLEVAHPVQVYADLQEHPERAKEAAVELRKSSLRWRA